MQKYDITSNTAKELENIKKNYPFVTGSKVKLNQVDKDIYQFSQSVMTKYTEFNREKVKHITIILSNKEIAISFKNGSSKIQKLDKNFEDTLFEIIEDRKKVYKNQMVDSIRMDLLTKKVFVDFVEF